ncbi:MAG: hypothetical protein U5K53_00645 [Halanaerobiales bacterium]|nr:hypothetical protein [Halanaerobiales bacterium]
MPNWEFYKYALVFSVIALILIAILNPFYLWPWGVVVFIIQLITVLLSDGLVKIIRKKYPESRYLIPGFVLYRRYFAFAFTVYLYFGVFNMAESSFAKLYFSLFVLGFMGLGLSIIMRILVAGELLDRFNDEDDKE